MKGPNESLLWTLVKNGRRAQAVIVPIGDARELRYLLDGEWYYTHLYLAGQGRQLLQAAAAKRQELEAKGWVQQPKGEQDGED